MSEPSSLPADPVTPRWAARAAGLCGGATWLAAGLAAWALDGRADLGSQALPLVLAAALSALWWPMAWLAPVCVLAVLGFNWHFVEPRGSLHVLLHRDTLLLLVMLAVSLGVATLMSRQRQLTIQAREQAQRITQLLALADALRQADTPAQMHAALARALTSLGLPTPVIGPGAPGLNPDEACGLAQCAAQDQAFGPGTGRFENLPAWYLPLRGGSGGSGTASSSAHDAGTGPAASAVLLRLPPVLAELPSPPLEALRAQAQALCDLTGQALARHAAQQQAEEARQRAHSAQWRNTWLAAIAHDYRTPLAAVLGAASSLGEQAQRLGPAQCRQLAGRIVDEVSHLVRITDNALQLARLDGPRPSGSPPRLVMDWQSPEELVGAVLHRLRQRRTAAPEPPAWPFAARLEPHLPLLRCDAVLIVQLLDNLLDNTLRHTPPGTPVEIHVRAEPGWLVMQVRDQGPGLPPAQQGWLASTGRTDQRPGTGLGLALCRAIAEEHGGSLRCLPAPQEEGQGPGMPGTCIELRLPCEPPPALPSDERPASAPPTDVLPTQTPTAGAMATNAAAGA